MPNIQTTEYKKFIKKIKSKVREAQIRASVKVNVELLKFYWEFGEEIIKKQKNSNWGSAFLKNLSQDLMREFPDVKGFSYRNIKYIRQWYLFYSTNTEKRQQVVALLIQIPWGHNLHIITKCKDINQALYYATQTLNYGWCRAVLVHQIESQLYEREGKALTNFSDTLPPPQSDLANQILKDPYNFDFLTMTKDYKERELASALPSIEEIEKELKSL